MVRIDGENEHALVILSNGGCISPVITVTLAIMHSDITDLE
jgi:hypothetical protein